jgi:hypothetical protein
MTIFNDREDSMLTRREAKASRRRLKSILGFFLLLAGYALLAISPDTPGEWVLIRVAVGFGLLFIGFGFAIMPWIARISGGEE